MWMTAGKISSPLYTNDDTLYRRMLVNNTNRMQRGLAPIGYDGYPVNLHHAEGKGKNLFNVVQMSQTAHQTFHKMYGYRNFINIRNICLN